MSGSRLGLLSSAGIHVSVSMYTCLQDEAEVYGQREKAYLLVLSFSYGAVEADCNFHIRKPKTLSEG